MDTFSLEPYSEEVKNSFEVIDNLAAPTSDSTSMIRLEDKIESKISVLEKPLDHQSWYSRIWDNLRVAVKIRTSKEAKIEYITKQAESQQEVCRELRQTVEEIAREMSTASQVSLNYGKALENEITALQSVYDKFSTRIPENEEEHAALKEDIIILELQSTLENITNNYFQKHAWSYATNQFNQIGTQIQYDKNDLELIELKLPLLKESYQRAEAQVQAWKTKIRKYQAQMVQIDLTLAEYQGLTQPQMVMLRGDAMIRSLSEKISGLSDTMTEINTEVAALHDYNPHTEKLGADQRHRELFDRMNGEDNEI
tara:strand:- start:15321 stop:16256 length:936 start_codon:yes stop_codon:yes gene_type:complete